MSDPVEDALHRMKPTDLPPGLMARLSAVRPQTEEVIQSRAASFFRRWLLPATAGMCAALLTFVFLNDEAEPMPEDATAAREAALPVERNDYLLGARHVGVVVGPDQRPYRIVEVEWMEADTIQPKEHSAGLRVETKRREVIPVALDIY